MKSASLDEMRGYARSARIDCVTMTSEGRSSHVGSGLSIMDILTVLYWRILRVDPERPGWDERDRFVLSKGHAAAALYAVLSARGFFSRDLLAPYYRDGSVLCGHVSTHGAPGVDHSTGALGHGLPVAVGMALASKRSSTQFRVFALLSDGECDEGSIWEAALFAAHHGLDDLVAIIDYNKIQSLDTVANTLGLEPLADKWRAFGWSVREVDGHDLEALTSELGSVPFEAGRPSCLIAHTTKGKGVSFMENSVLWHYRPASPEELAAALEELSR